MKLGQYAASKAGLEIKTLWELSKKIKLRHGRHDVHYTISSARDKLKANGTDRLAEKLMVFGNDGRWARDRIRSLAQEVFEHKAPARDALGDYVSVEIECFLPGEHAVTDFVTWVRRNGYSKGVTVKNDGSLHPDRVEDCRGCSASEDGNDCECEPDEIGKEIIVTFKRGDTALLEAVCKQLNDLGASVNKTCGLHVHFDCRHLTVRQVGTRGKRLALAVPALKQMLPQSRQNNQYCRETINKMRSGSRYAFVNMQAYRKHATIEVRGHSGTTDALKIARWIDILTTVMDRRNTKELPTVEDLVTVARLNPVLATYAMNRRARFAKPSRVSDDVADDNIGLDSVA